MATVGLTGGAALGLFCRVFVLVPAHAVLLILAALAAGSGLMPVGRVIFSTVLISVACEVGYLAAALCATAMHLRGRALPLRRLPH